MDRRALRLNMDNQSQVPGSAGRQMGHSTRSGMVILSAWGDCLAQDADAPEYAEPDPHSGDRMHGEHEYSSRTSAPVQAVRHAHAARREARCGEHRCYLTRYSLTLPTKAA
jgi:hypothetical protein